MSAAVQRSRRSAPDCSHHFGPRSPRPDLGQLRPVPGGLELGVVGGGPHPRAAATEVGLQACELGLRDHRVRTPPAPAVDDEPLLVVGRLGHGPSMPVRAGAGPREAGNDEGPGEPGPSISVSVREGGFEPPRPFGHCDLNAARLPFRHSREKQRQRYPTLTARSQSVRSGTPRSPAVAAHHVPKPPPHRDLPPPPRGRRPRVAAHHLPNPLPTAICRHPRTRRNRPRAGRHPRTTPTGRYARRHRPGGV